MWDPRDSDPSRSPQIALVRRGSFDIRLTHPTPGDPTRRPFRSVESPFNEVGCEIRSQDVRLSCPHSETRSSSSQLDRLILDPKNPRLSDAEQAAAESQSELLQLIDREYDPLTIAESIAEHGYFASEPMIVLDEGNDTFTVLEGNRRLAALKGLADPQISSHFKEPERWENVRQEAEEIPAEIPVIRAESRLAVAPLIGYRHISGIEPWKPLQKARFIADLVDQDDRLSFDQVREQVGEPRSTVAALYRNRAMLEQARDWGIDTSGAENAFGVFTAALNRRALREFVHAAPAPQVDERAKPLPDTDEARAALEELLGWVFGEDRIVKDSRRLRDLALVVDSPRALAVLRDTQNLAEAYSAAGGPQQQIVKRLRSAADGMHDSVRDLNQSPELVEDTDVADTAQFCIDLASELADLFPDDSEQ